MTTKFIIRNGDYYLANHVSNQHWTVERNLAKEFEFYTIALGVAVTLELDSYIIESVN